MRKLVLFFLLISQNGWSQELDMKPGLWEFSKEIMVNGVKFTSPEAPASEELTKICYTKKMIENPQEIVGDEQRGPCKYIVGTRTKDKLEVTTSCDNGLYGKTTLEIINPKDYKMTASLKNAADQHLVLKTEGKFLRDECDGHAPAKN